jgi:hypothetical protein
MKSPKPNSQPANDGSKDASGRETAKDVKDNKDPDLQGEGNYTAARRHRESAEAFVESGRVDDAADAAAPKDETEARELKAAEKAGRAPARR